ncbi:MAG: 6-phosphofructokinase, partial [Anaerolineales bacterium]
MANDTGGAIGVLTSGGDAPGMNAALRAVVRTALGHGVTVFAIYEGYQGLVDGGDRLRSLTWDDVGGIMQQGGTIIGTARCAAFRTREGRLLAARHLLERGIDRLVVIGGDGSLTGAHLFRQEWPSLVADLAAQGAIAPETAARHPQLAIVGLVGSIDNDFFGTDMTIGADTALHRITTALDQIGSTAASHQRTFVVEVMGRNCGYLALMATLAGAAHWVFLPESPPETDDWEATMCEVLAAGRAAGRRHSTVVVAEGARDRNGNPITSERVRQVLEDHLHEEVRVTILGHIQRGGAPSAFDRWMSTLLGHAAVEQLLTSTAQDEPQVIGLRYNRITRLPLLDCVQRTRAVAEAVSKRDYEQAMELRGGSFREQFRNLRTLIRTVPHP